METKIAGIQDKTNPIYRDRIIIAKRVRKCLENQWAPREKDAVVYRVHLNNCKEKPTLGALIERKYITKKPFPNPHVSSLNKKLLGYYTSVSKLEKGLEKIIETNYNRTKNLRKYIINNDRVVLNEVKQCQGYKFLKN